MGAVFPAITGVMLYGWRALAMLAVILPTVLASMLVWRKIGARGRQLHLAHGIWMGMLLWLMLPAHLLQGAVSTSLPQSGLPLFRWELWPIPIAASLLLVMLMWLLGGVGAGRVHPALVTYLLLVVAFDQLLTPYTVLQRHRLFTGDVLKTASPSTPTHAYMKDGYLGTAPVEDADALALEPAAARLLSFTSGQRRPGRSWISLDSLLRDEMPPLEDMIIGGQPGAIGGSCAVAVIIGGLYLLYRGTIDFRVPLAIFIGALIGFMALPIPVIIKEPEATPGAATRLASAGGEQQTVYDKGGPQWRWLAFREHEVIEVGWAKAFTFANYELMAGPMLLMTFFFATAPAVRPMARRARVMFGLLVGVLAAGMQLYVAISYGPYLALLIVSVMTPLLDRVFRQHPLV